MSYKKEKVLIYDSKEWYDKVAKIYNTFHKKLNERDKAIYKRFLPKDMKWMKVLEIGWGDGRVISEFAGKWLEEYVLTDISENMLKRSKNWVTKIIMDAEQVFPFEDGSFEIVLCLFTISHIWDLSNVFEESRRVLKENWIFIVWYNTQRRDYEYNFGREKFKIKSYNYSYKDIEKMAEYNFFDINYVDLNEDNTTILRTYCFTKK